MSTNKDILENLFSQLPEEKLSDNFRYKLMVKIQAEAIRAHRRKEQLGLLSVIIASLFMLAMAIGSFIYYFNWDTNNLQEYQLPVLSFSVLIEFPLYLFMGIAILLLLFADYLIRRYYKKKYSFLSWDKEKSIFPPYYFIRYCCYRTIQTLMVNRNPKE